MTNGHALLRKYRKKHGISCKDFAQKLGIGHSTMRSLENGTRAITPERAVVIEQATGREITRAQLLPALFEGIA